MEEVYQVQSAKYNWQSKVIEFRALISVSDNRFAASVGGYVEMSGYHLRIDSISPIQPGDLVIIAGVIASMEDNIIREIQILSEREE